MGGRPHPRPVPPWAGACAQSDASALPRQHLCAKAAWLHACNCIGRGRFLLEAGQAPSAPNDSADAKPFSVHDRGCYVCMEGPAFSTRAESLMHRLWGGDLIGMTAMPEAKLAREAEMSYALVALVTDYDCWRRPPAAAVESGGGKVENEAEQD